MRTRAKVVALSLMLGFVVGVSGTSRIRASAMQQCDGCCEHTTNCGSPSEYRCCLPKEGEANCGPEVCPNYCVTGTSCGGAF